MLKPVCFVLFFIVGEAKREGGQVLYVFGNGTPSVSAADTVQRAFDAVYNNFNDTFDFTAFDRALSDFKKGVERYRMTDAYSAYTYYPDRPHCDLGSVAAPHYVSGLAAFPGGITQRTFGSDFARSIHDLSEQARGPASAGLLPIAALHSQSLSIGKGMVQSAIASMVHTVPPLVPPPSWNNQPLQCVPMVTGHNCFGAVLYPITMADFVLADVTDSMLDGVIAGFPNTYATKVGKTSDDMYQACFASYMSMHCSSIFPRCTTPQSRDEPIPVGGRVPMCLHLCIMPLVMCPGLWVEDIIGTCSMVSVPPMCTQAFFLNLWRLPPQYTSFDEAHPFPRECPSLTLGTADDEILHEDANGDDANGIGSPILREAGEGFAITR